MEIKELNEKYYSEFSRLLNAQKFLTEKQYKHISGVIFKQYLQELDRFLKYQQLEYGVTDFELEYKVNKYVPKRRKFWGLNKIAKRHKKLHNAEFSKYLLTLTDSLTEMKDDIKKMLEKLKAKNVKGEKEKPANKEQEQTKALVPVDRELLPTEATEPEQQEL